MASSARKESAKKSKPLDPTGVADIDGIDLKTCSIADCVRAFSAYVREQRKLPAGPKKAAQIRLSNALGHALALDLKTRLPKLDLYVGERPVAGALRTVNADVSERHDLDGLRLAVELKPVNLAVGRAIWNRFGDLRTFAVNIHLKFPFSVIGGVLVIPTYEEIGSKEAKKAAADEEAVAEADTEALAEVRDANRASKDEGGEEEQPGRRDTTGLIERAIARLMRAGGRKTEADAPHLLEGIAVVAYDPDTGLIDPMLPKPGTGLRWDEFVDALVKAYEARFE